MKQNGNARDHNHPLMQASEIVCKLRADSREGRSHQHGHTCPLPVFSTSVGVIGLEPRGVSATAAQR